jgi:hypothetical protein
MELTKTNFNYRCWDENMAKINFSHVFSYIYYMEFKEWLKQQELNEGLPKWTRKLTYPLIAAAGIGSSRASENPFNITVAENPPETNQPVKDDFGIDNSPWKQDFKNINKISGSKSFPHDSSHDDLHNLKKQALADPEFFKNLNAIVEYMHSLEFRQNISKLSGYKNIPEDVSTKELFEKMWGQYKHPELELTKEPFYKSYSAHDPRTGRNWVRLGTAMDNSGEIPNNPYLGAGHEYVHQTQGTNKAYNSQGKIDATDEKGYGLCELPTCLGEGIWVLMAAEKQAKSEHRKSPFQGKSIRLPNGKDLDLDFLVNQSKRFNAFENPAKLTKLLASPIGIAWLKNITTNTQDKSWRIKSKLQDIKSQLEI